MEIKPYPERINLATKLLTDTSLPQEQCFLKGKPPPILNNINNENLPVEQCLGSPITDQWQQYTTQLLQNESIDYNKFSKEEQNFLIKIKSRNTTWKSNHIESTDMNLYKSLDSQNQPDVILPPTQISVDRLACIPLQQTPNIHDVAADYNYPSESNTTNLVYDDKYMTYDKPSKCH